MNMHPEGTIDMGVDPAASPINQSLYNYNLFVSGRGNNPLNAPIGVGIYSRPSLANDPTGFRQYSIFAEANGGNQNGSAVAVYGTINNPGSNDYAGYFNGDVLSTGVYIGSDKRLKKDIKQETSALEKIMQLKPVS